MDEINNLCLQRRAHLTKEQRLPQYLKETEKIIRTVKSCKSNFKTVLANSRLRGSIFKKVYNLSLNVLKYYNYIQKIIDKIDLLEKEKFLRREIASVLIYEIIFGINNLPGESKIITTIRAYERDIMKAHQDLQYSSPDSFVLKEINIPRYVRVHTLVTTVPYVVKDLECLGFKQINYDYASEEKYLELIKNLEQGYFLIDFHFKDILVFACNENLTSLDLYKNGHIILQDKASYIPVQALNPEPGCAVLDACAAPGIKTIHIASKMKNKGILIACERDKDRFESLKEMIQHGALKICKVLCKDFKSLDPNDQAYSTIEFILLDPSCSGSGMVSRMDEVTDTEDSKNKERLMKLAGFQIILLKHALRFPSVKRVVYSTCSVNEEENEYVVHEALNSCYGTFKLVSVMPEWSVRGSESFEFGSLCLRTVPEKHFTNGFFVAMFERVNPSECKKRVHSSKNKKYEINNNNLQNEDGNCSNFKKFKENEREENVVDLHEKCESYKLSTYHFEQNDKNSLPSKQSKKKNSTSSLHLLNQSSEGGEISNQFMEDGHMTKQINFDCEPKKTKLKKKKKKEGENLINFPPEVTDSKLVSPKLLKKDSTSMPDLLSQSSEGGEISSQYTKEGHVTEQIKFHCESKKIKKHKKKKKKEKNLINFDSEENKELTTDDHEENVLHKKNHESCQLSLYQLKQNDNNSLSSKQSKKKENASSLDLLSHFPEGGEIGNQFMEEGLAIKQINLEYKLKTKKLKKKREKNSISCSEDNKEWNIDDHERNTFDLHKKKKHESCVSPYQLMQNDNHSLLLKQLKKKDDNSNASDRSNQVQKGSESSKQFMEEKQANFDESMKAKKHKKKGKKDKKFNFYSEANEEKLLNRNSESKECSMEIISSSEMRTVDDTLEVPKAKEKHKHKRHLSSKIMSESVERAHNNSDLPLHKKEKIHSKKSGFLCSSLVTDKNLSLPQNQFSTSSEKMVSNLNSSSKHEKSKKYKRSITPHENFHLSPAVELDKIISETAPQNSEGCASFRNDYITNKKFKKTDNFKRTDEIDCHDIFASTKNDFTEGNRSKKHKSRKHKIEKTVDVEISETVPNNSEMMFCASIQNDHILTKKNKKHRIEKTEEIVPCNPEGMNTSIKNCSVVRKKIKKCKSKKHEKMDDLKKCGETSLSLHEKDEANADAKYDFICSLPNSEEELEAVLFINS